MIELISKWKAASRKLENESGRQPSTQDLAAAMNLPLKKVRIIRRAVRAFHMSPGTVQNPSGDTVGMGELLADSRVGTPDEHILRRDELSTLKMLMDTIDQREADVLRLRFGLDGSTPLTLQEISQELGISRERVRQVIVDSLARLNSRLTDEKPSRYLGAPPGRTEDDATTLTPEYPHAHYRR